MYETMLLLSFRNKVQSGERLKNIVSLIWKNIMSFSGVRKILVLLVVKETSVSSQLMVLLLENFQVYSSKEC